MKKKILCTRKCLINIRCILENAKSIILDTYFLSISVQTCMNKNYDDQTIYGWSHAGRP